MLKEILAITGKPGLFRIKAHSGKSLIVEDIESGKKFPVSMRDRVVSLGDIAMYTEGDDKPLGEILDAVYATEKGCKIDVKSLVADGKLKEQFAVYVTDFDRDRVRDSDIKKLFNWYNLLVDAGFDKFTEEESNEEEGAPEEKESTESKAEETAEDKTKK